MGGGWVIGSSYVHKYVHIDYVSRHILYLSLHRHPVGSAKAEGELLALPSGTKTKHTNVYIIYIYIFNVANSLNINVNMNIYI